MAILILLSALMFAAVGLFAWQTVPAGTQAVAAYQSKKVKEATAKLDELYVYVPQKKLKLIYTLVPLGTGLVGFVLTKNVWLGAAAMIFGLIVPAIVIKVLAAKRLATFEHQLIDGLMILTSSLRGGLSLLQAIEELVNEIPPPIQQEFAMVLKEVKMGVPLDEALERLNKRVKSDELNLVITAILVARETGGNLSEPFSRLVNTMRERDKIQSKVKTLTMQARLQGIIMSAIPVLFAITVYYFLNPEFFRMMISHQVGRMLLWIALCLEIVGSFFLRKFSRTEVF
jgi:tight adherence protein B